MSFNDMTLIELKKVAEEFGVDSPVKITKQKMIDLLNEEGVNYDVYKHFDKIGKDAEDKKAQEEQAQQQQQQFQQQQFQPPQYFAPKNILIKMDRANYSYQVGRFMFTEQHPYIAMTEAEANYIFANHAGFRMATPLEVQNFYS